jgi:exonuclease SbcC
VAKLPDRIPDQQELKRQKEALTALENETERRSGVAGQLLTQLVSMTEEASEKSCELFREGQLLREKKNTLQMKSEQHKKQSEAAKTVSVLQDEKAENLKLENRLQNEKTKNLTEDSGLQKEIASYIHIQVQRNIDAIHDAVSSLRTDLENMQTQRAQEKEILKNSYQEVKEKIRQRDSQREVIKTLETDLTALTENHQNQLRRIVSIETAINEQSGESDREMKNLQQLMKDTPDEPNTQIKDEPNIQPEPAGQALSPSQSLQADRILEQCRRELEALNAAIAQAKAAIDRLRILDDGLKKCRKQQTDLQEQILSLGTKLGQTRQSLAHIKETIAHLQSQTGEELPKETEEKILSCRSLCEEKQKQYAAAEKAFRETREKEQALRAGIETLRGQLPKEKSTGMEALEQELEQLRTIRKEALERQSEAYAVVKRNREIYEKVQTGQGSLVSAEQEYVWMKALSDTASGTLNGKQKIELETFIQMTYFDRIVRRANLRLLSMSSGQYELKRQENGDNFREKAGLDLNVIDHYNATERSVRTLSGGETFQASLALALGLADEISASAGGVRLDALFVDEGFGSLDEEALNQALKTLLSLTQGNRMVGIISHVSELKDRIDRKIIVTKSRGLDEIGSHVELQY